MNTYLVVMRQGDGCDYTIGCGMAVELHKADTVEEAFNKWADGRELNLEGEPGIAEYYLPGGEGELHSVHVYEVNGSNNAHLWEDFIVRKEQEKQVYINKEAEAKERAELERLKKKYG